MKKDTWNDKKVLAKLRRQILDRLEIAGEFVEGQAKLKLRNQKAVDEGTLMGSINYKVNKKDLSVTIGTRVEYAPYVEFGTGEFAESGNGRKGGWFYVTDRKHDKGLFIRETEDGKFLYFTKGMKPRPFLKPALEENKPEIKRILTGNGFKAIIEDE